MNREVVPRHWKVVQTVRERMTCRACDTVSQPPAPFHPIARGRAGPELLATILEAKFSQHLPLNRQSETFAREGIELDVSTMADWVGACTATLAPLTALIRTHVLAGERIHGDETTVPVLAKNKTITGRLWAYVRDDQPFGGPAPPAAVFHYSPDRRGEHPNKHLAGYAGILQADAYAGFNDLYRPGRKPGPLTKAGCWAHTIRTQLRFGRNKKNDYVLRCLLKCGACGLGIHGFCSAAANGRSGHRYYKCAGTDALTTGRDARCPRARIDADALEQAVWDHITGLLGSLSQLSAQFERFVAEADAAQTRKEAPSQHLRARLDRLDRADRRLLEAYQAEVISLAELADRRQGLAEQRRLAEQQLEQHRRLREQQVHAQDVLDSLAAFSERIGARLHSASVADRQALLQLVVERITVHDVLRDNLDGTLRRSG